VFVVAIEIDAPLIFIRFITSQFHRQCLGVITTQKFYFRVLFSANATMCNRCITCR